jgi:hypothetical protein
VTNCVCSTLASSSRTATFNGLSRPIMAMLISCDDEPPLCNCPSGSAMHIEQPVRPSLTLGSAGGARVPTKRTFCKNFHAAALIPRFCGWALGSSTKDSIRALEDMNAS